MKTLAINGGIPAVTVNAAEQWRRPVEEEKAAVCALIDEGFLSGSGRGLPLAFEEAFRAYLGCKYVLTTSHGHLALASAFFAAGLGAGDEIIHPAIGYLGSYAGALHMGATPVFCETDPATLLADPADIERRITSRTRVVSPIHWHGRVCDMDRLLEICNRRGVVLVEDAAHAHGSEWGGVKIGNLGHIACFSLQGITPGGKPVHGGEGGILATNDRALYERALVYAHLHRAGALEELTDPVLKALDIQLMGWKWRAHPLALAIAQISLGNLPYRIENFIANRDDFYGRLAGIPGIAPARDIAKSKGAELYAGLMLRYLPEQLDDLPVEIFCEALKAEGVPVSTPVFRAPEHLRSLFTQDLPGLWGRGHAGPANMPLPRYKAGDYPVSERIWNNTIGLPGWIEAAPGAITQVAEAFRKVAAHSGELQPAGRVPVTAAV